MKLSEQLRERLRLLLVNKKAIESNSPTSFLSGYLLAIRDVEIAEGQAEKNQTDDGYICKICELAWAAGQSSGCKLCSKA